VLESVLRATPQEFESLLDDISELVDRMDRNSPANAPSAGVPQLPAVSADYSKSRPMPWIQEDSASL
jgi:hypothetical protein